MSGPDRAPGLACSLRERLEDLLDGWDIDSLRAMGSPGMPSCRPADAEAMLDRARELRGVLEED